MWAEGNFESVAVADADADADAGVKCWNWMTANNTTASLAMTNDVGELGVNIEAGGVGRNNTPLLLLLERV